VFHKVFFCAAAPQTLPGDKLPLFPPHHLFNQTRSFEYGCSDLPSTISLSKICDTILLSDWLHIPPCHVSHLSRSN
jgi:hypothetical protein